MDFTVIIPFRDGHAHIDRLLDSLPKGFPVIVVDDVSKVPYQLNSRHKNVTVHRLKRRGYFTGAVNAGIRLCSNDVLILNQDVYFTTDYWMKSIDTLVRNNYMLYGERIGNEHPAWSEGYIHGTFMYIRRYAINKLGLLNQRDYPLWGSTCEYQLRASREGMKVMPHRPIPGMVHTRKGGMGDSIRELLREEPLKAELFIRTPPRISVIVSCYNYGRYLPDLVNSFIGGETSLGHFPQQSFASFEMVIVDDASTDDSWEWCQKVADPWKGVRCIRRQTQGGTAVANNTGIKNSYGRYITVMNADDMREPGSLERLYRMQIKNPHSMIYDGILPFADGERRPDIKVGVAEYDFERLIYKNHIHAGIMFPRKAWHDAGGYPVSFGDGREDWAMNIALGIQGYCGVYIPEIGYLYRREKQNRTLRNTNPSHHKYFLAKMQATFPNIYQGVRPMSCCGGSRTRAVAPRRAITTTSVPGGEGMILLEYVGKSHGTQTFYGPVTGAQYPAGLSSPVVPVDERDLHSSNPRTPGLLDIRESGNFIFRQYKPVEQPKVEAEPEPDPIIVEASEDEWTEMPEELDESRVVIDPSMMTVSEINEYVPTSVQALKDMLSMEMDGKNRKTAIEVLERKLNELG